MLTADELVCERCGISPVLCGCRPCGPSPRAVPTSWMGKLHKRPLGDWGGMVAFDFSHPVLLGGRVVITGVTDPERRE